MAANFTSDCYRRAAVAIAPATLLLISLLGPTAMSDERTIPISEVRQRFERVKTNYQEPDSAGFVLRVSAGSFGYAIAWLVFAGVLAALPFRLGTDINSESFQGGQGIAWTLWAAALLVLIGAAVFAWFSEIRITKTGDHGEIFSGLGPLGRTHRFEWSGFSDVRDYEFAQYTGTRTTRT